MLSESTVLCERSNVAVSDNILLREGLRELQSRLPGGWSVVLDRSSQKGPKRKDAIFRVTAPDQRSGVFAVEVQKRLEPRGVGELAARPPATPVDAVRLVLAPHLSQSVCRRLTEAGLSFLDLTGNGRLELQEPGLLIQTQGALTNPDREARSSQSLRGVKAGRIVRLLVDSKLPPGVRELADRAGVDPGYVSRILGLLDRQALVERRGYGRIVKVDWSQLLRRWAQDAPLESRGTQIACLDPRGLPALLARLKEFAGRYALTGTLAAEVFAPVTPSRLATLYLDDVAESMPSLGLRPAEAGANVLVIEPKDDGVFIGAAPRGGLTYVAPSQAAADLLTSPGRGPAEAESLIAWLVENEDAWRG